MGRKNYAIESGVKPATGGLSSKSNVPNRQPKSLPQTVPRPPVAPIAPRAPRAPRAPIAPIAPTSNPNQLCCTTFTGHAAHQGRFQYLGDRPLEITSSLKGYGNRGCSSDVIYRSETTDSSRCWKSNLNIRGWKYLRWAAICLAILLVISLIVFFSVADLQNASRTESSPSRETYFDVGVSGGGGGGGASGGGGGDGGDGGSGGDGGRLLAGDVVTLDGNVIVDIGGVTFKEGNYRVTPGEPLSDNFKPDSEKNNNGSGEQDFMEIVKAPDLTTSPVINLNGSTLLAQNTPVNGIEKSYTDFIHTIPDLVLKVHTLMQDGDKKNSATKENSTLHDLEQKETKSIPGKPAYEETDEMMMTSDRDLSSAGAEGARSRHTNAHSRQAVHPTIPSSVLERTKEILGNPFATPNETESSCFSTRLEFCKGVLPYDLTTLPLVPGVASLADLDAALPYFEMIVQSGCSKRATQFVCSVLEPECQPMGNSVLPPCRKACKAVAEDCSDFMLATLDLSKVFHCDLYPDDQDAGHCVNFAKGETCLDDEFRCSDGTCIPKRWECDNIGDCPSSDDEANCSICTEKEFKCKKDRKCVPLDWQCNGNKDCTDGSDEVGCLQLAETSSGHSRASPCPAGELRCVDGRCITMQQLCDNVHDCTDGADEGNCGL